MRLTQSGERDTFINIRIEFWVFNGGIMVKKLMALIASATFIFASLLLVAPSANAVYCADGSWSNSSGRGTCSWHGGIDRSGSEYGSSNSYGKSNGRNSLGGSSNNWNSSKKYSSGGSLGGSSIRDCSYSSFWC